MRYSFTFLGQSILKYQVPQDIYLAINHIYETTELPRANDKLVGKIEKEHSLFYGGKDEEDRKKHNHLPGLILKWFEETFQHYLKFNKVLDYRTELNSIWVNEMKEHEYNPIHIHQGNINTGLSSVMILKLPETFGVEYSAAKEPNNGKLTLIGSASGMFSNVDFMPDMQPGDFYVFPYDMRHCVTPFNGKGFRRTLAANCDVNYNSLRNQSAFYVSQ
tara:strand:+ start:1276 stop:1929 length:654 start_codon:yes stop_codon:yes gene_type:complete